MKILVSIASGANNTERNVLRSFYEGIERYYFQLFAVNNQRILKKQHGIDLRMSYDNEIEWCDIAVQFGTVKPRAAEHHVTRQSIQKKAEHVIYIETPLLGRTIVEGSKHQYYRVGIDGFMNNDGIFYGDSIDKTRLPDMKRHLDIPEFAGWKDHSIGNILVLLQLPGDASLRGQKMSEWLLETLSSIREITNRPIVVRFHPAMSAKGRAEFYGEIGDVLFKNYQNITWSNGLDKNLQEELSGAGVCITYTSGSAIDAVLAGVPVIAMDEGNLGYPISSHRINDLLNPKKIGKLELNRWINQLANSQWSESEMIESKVWQHLLPLLGEL